MKIDLHIHTNYSDGSFTPQEIVDLALEQKLDVIAITDHDNILAYDIAKKYALENNKKIEILKGVEINTIYKDFEVHILGYFMDETNSDFINLLKSQQQARINQTQEIIRLINKREKINIKFEDIKKLVAQGGSIGRPHIARALVNAGKLDSVVEAYKKYINNDSPVYVPRQTVSPHEAVEIIYEAGGIPVFAHPIDVDMADKLAKELVSFGLRGIEVYHRKHSPAVIEYYSTLAEDLGLVITGGSDFHTIVPGGNKIVLGNNFVPSWVYDKLITEKKRIDMA